MSFQSNIKSIVRVLWLDRDDSTIQLAAICKDGLQWWHWEWQLGLQLWDRIRWCHVEPLPRPRLRSGPLSRSGCCARKSGTQFRSRQCRCRRRQYNYMCNFWIDWITWVRVGGDWSWAHGIVWEQCGWCWDSHWLWPWYICMHFLLQLDRTFGHRGGGERRSSRCRPPATMTGLNLNFNLSRAVLAQTQTLSLRVCWLTWNPRRVLAMLLDDAIHIRIRN